MEIPFNIPPCVGAEETYIAQAVAARKICGDGAFTQKCSAWLKEQSDAACVLLTTSCTHALEMAALLADIRPGDEIIAPSFTFVSTVNAFVLRGATAVFTDIRPDTMNLDETLVEDAITERTRAIVPVHYAGVGCEMDTLLEIARRHNLFVIEDAAQAVGSLYKNRPLGALGDFGCYSFHETKNFSMGEGGALLLRDSERIEAAEIIREKGTNRSKFLRGTVDKYTWIDKGSSYLPSELNAAYLWPQLKCADKISANRMRSWERYYRQLTPLAKQGRLELPVIPKECSHNAHMFYVKTRNLEDRAALTAYLRQRGVSAAFHYVPLHSAPAGKRFGRFHGNDRYTTAESERLLRLPMFYGLTPEQIDTVCSLISDYYSR